MKAFWAVVFALGGIVGGLWLGFWKMFIGGWATLITTIFVTHTATFAIIAWSVVGIVAGGFVTWALIWLGIVIAGIIAKS